MYKFLVTGSVLLVFCLLGLAHAQNADKQDEKELIEAFVNLKDVPQPFAQTLAELKTKYDAGELRELRQLIDLLQKTYFGKNTPDPSAIPYLIALIEADNSSDTVYGVGYFSLSRMTGVWYSEFHDSAFWKRWWERNKTNFPEEFQKIGIPELPKTRHGKTYEPYPEKMETLDGLLEYLESRFSPEVQKNTNPNDPKAIMRLEGGGGIMGFQGGGVPVFKPMAFSGLAQAIARFNDPKAIPYLIGAIDADNSGATIGSIGLFLQGLTGVEYNVFHDGAFWKRWWEKNKANYPEDIQRIKIPEYPKTPYGKTYVPYPVETETLQGQLRFFQSHAKRVKPLSWGNPIAYRPALSEVATSIARFNDPTAIPYLIAVVDFDSEHTQRYGTGNGQNCLIYIAGYYGLGYGNPPLTDVRWDESHDGTWWKNWWEENKHKFPEAVQNIPIPSIHDEWIIPDLSKEVALWRQEKAEAEKRSRYEKMLQELAESDVADVPAERLHVEGNEKMEYFLIGVDKENPVPESGYRLVVVMPGGSGDALFHPFVRRIWKYAMDESDGTSKYIIAQPIAVRWTPNQQIVWATENVRVEKQEFSTELFVESVVADVSNRVKIDPKYVFTLSWSSSGPAAYSIALQEKTAITGSYILMSVFKPNELPPLENAKGRLFAIQHSPEDRICPFRMAKEAEERLTEHGATVKFMEYPGGHGWSGNVYGRIRENLDWLQTICREHKDNI